MFNSIPRFSSRSNFFTFIALMAILLFLFNEPAFAQTTNSGLPWDGWFTKVRSSITGPFATTIALLSIITAGTLLAFGGEIGSFMKTLIFIVLVMGMVLGANSMITTLFGQGYAVSKEYSDEAQRS